MDMENSRRSTVDRSREPGLKKPRLVDDVTNRDRSVPQPRAGPPTDPRLRVGERDREEPSRAASGTYQQQQELVSQYKTALSELTFNSKPIITNLTIIAGENLHAAKAIASTVCNNILEVPSEQKLPSLYLLDSIVKNIGRDYIKHFAARLPEVFCKAYKHVDSSIHPGMRHLFGTWKGVFPAGPLQIIEKELGFAATVNGSSGTTVSKPDSETQRQPHGIHVNPKYLEARQRLQQSARAKEINRGDMASAMNSMDNVERSDRMAISGSSKQWADQPNAQRSQREQLSEPVLENKAYIDYAFSSNYSRPDSRVGRVSEAVKERDTIDKPWYGNAGSTVSKTLGNKRNGVDVNQGYGKFIESGATLTDHQVRPLHFNEANRGSGVISKSWKNSEEEEYLWEDMHSRSTGYGEASGLMKCGQDIDDTKPVSMLRRKWIPRETEHLDSRQNQLEALSQYVKSSVSDDRVPPSRGAEDTFLPARQQTDADPRIKMESPSDTLPLRRTSLGHTPSLWPLQEPHSSVMGLDHSSSRIAGQSETQPTRLGSSLQRSGRLTHSIPPSVGLITNVVSGSRGTFGLQASQSLRPSSPSHYMLPSSAHLQQQNSPSSADPEQLQSHSSSQGIQKPLLLSGNLNRVHASASPDSFQSHGVPNPQALAPQSQYLQNSSAPPATFLQSRHHLPFDQLLQQTQAQSSHSSTLQKQPPLPQGLGTQLSDGFSSMRSSNSPAVDVTGQADTSSLLMGVMKSGLLPNTLASNSHDLRPPLPSGPPPIHVLTSSGPSVIPSSASLPMAHTNVSNLTSSSMRGVLPPLPPGPPPQSSLLSSKSSSAVSATSNPLSSLLSSLVAKGLISSPASEVPTVTSHIHEKPSDKISNDDSSNSLVACSTSASSKGSAPPMSDHSGPESSAPINVTFPVSNTGLNDLIGLDFKADVIREHHPSVISGLFDDLKQQCSKCGLRFRLKEQLDHHSDKHPSEKLKGSSCEGISREWYADPTVWISRSTGQSSGPGSGVSFAEDIPVRKDYEPMVTADESQSICLFCGEPFEDFYCEEKDEWMYEGTMYLNEPETLGNKGSMDEGMGQVPIVHAKCVASSAANHADFPDHNEMSWTSS